MLTAAVVADVSAEGFTAGATCVLQGLELAVPGTYIAGEPVVTIAAFAPQLHVITSKQRPRKLTIHGSDGAEYMFLLKASKAPAHCILTQAFLQLSWGAVITMALAVCARSRDPHPRS